MCTCINFIGNKNYFGRNLDLEYSFNEKVIITPRKYKLNFKKEKDLENHYSMIGIGTVIDNYPLYAEACNEFGLSFACLNFPNNCMYYELKENKHNYAPYELPLFLLGTCKTVDDVMIRLPNINIINLQFSNNVNLTPLHFMISDNIRSIVVETTSDDMKIYDNPFNVLTNNPPFTYHYENVKNYLYLSNNDNHGSFNNKLNLKYYSNGQGGQGLPGDYSSSSRFIKALFILNHLQINDNEKNNVMEFFNCLESVKMIQGSVVVNNKFEYTRYSSCINTKEGILYYKTYESPLINKVELHNEKLNTKNLIIYDLNNNFEFNKSN